MKKYLPLLFLVQTCFGLPLTVHNIPQVFTTTSLSNGPMAVINGGADVATLGGIGAATIVGTNSVNFGVSLNGIASNVVQRISGLTSDAQTQITANGAAISVNSASIVTLTSGLVTTSNRVETIASGLVTTSNRVETVNALMAAATNAINTTLSGKQDSFTTGRGITNNGGTLSNNITAGSNITLTTGSNGQITIASSASGGGGTVGTLINTTSTTAGQLVQFSDTQKTNTTPVSTGLGITNNASTLSNNIVAGTSISIAAGANGQLTISNSRFRAANFTQIAISNSVVDTDLVNFTIPGGTLGLTNSILVTGTGAVFNNNISDTIIFRLKFNGNTYYQDTTLSLGASATSRAFVFGILVSSGGSTTAEFAGGNISIGATGGATSGTGDLGANATLGAPILSGASANENHAADMTFQFSAQLGSAASTFKIVNLSWRAAE